MIRNQHVLCAAAVFVLLAPCASIAQVKQAAWRTDYDSARKESSDKGLPLFLEVYAEGCVHCKRLEAGPLRDPAVTALLANRFIPIRVDAATAPKLMEALRIQSYPTIVIAHADGRVAEFIEGYRDAKPLLDHLQRAIAVEAPAPPAINPVKPPTETRESTRNQRAKELLAQARDAMKSAKYDAALDLCRILEGSYKDLEEGIQAASLAAEIRSSPEKMAIASEHLNERLASMYASLGESWLSKGDKNQAATYFEKAVRTAPASAIAREAQAKLASISRKLEK